MSKKLFSLLKLKNLLSSKLALAGIGAVVLLGGGYLLFAPKAPSYQFVPVTRGTIVQTVSITGNTTPSQSVSLAFGNSGTVAHVYAKLGAKVGAGQTLAELNTGDLFAQLRQAQANVDTQQAKLDSLRAGSRPEDIAASQAALDKAQQDLANLYQSIADAASAAYTQANDAVRTELDPLFSNAETNTPQLTFITSNSQAETDAESARIVTSAKLAAWQSELSVVSSGSTAPQMETLLTHSLSNLSVIRDLLSKVSLALDGATNLSAATLAADKSAVGAGQTEVNTAIKNLNTISQSISSQKLTVSQAQAQLNLKQAGSTPEDIAAQAAAVEAAQASVQSAAAKLQNSRLVAPFSGVVTQMDAKVGQYASPATALVSLISSGGYEVDAGVSETDIGKLKVGDTASMTLDAFPNENFTGKVFYIAPAETNTQGVINYQVKIAFDTVDPRLKSGLTCNVSIEANRKDNVLILPQYAILQNDSGTFVQTVVNGKVSTEPVTLGISDELGNVEVLSGVSEGQQVLNIGLKK